MNTSRCIGRIRVCAFCSRKFWDTEEMVFFDEDWPDKITVCCAGESPRDQMICRLGWEKAHPGTIVNFKKGKLAQVETYFTWPPELALVT